VYKSHFKNTEFIVLRCLEMDCKAKALDQHPQYLIQNQTKSIDLEYEQRTNRSDLKWTVKAGTS